MGLNFGSTTRSSDNTFVVKETIMNAERVAAFPNSDRKNDFVLKLTFSEVEAGGRKFTPEMHIAGNFKKNAEGKVTGWGSAFKIRNVFNACGVAGSVDDEGRVPETLIASLIGREIYVLKYVFRDDGKKHYKLWPDAVLGVSEKNPQEALKREFFDSHKKGYPKDFVPVAETGAQTVDTTAAGLPEEVPTDW